MNDIRNQKFYEFILKLINIGASIEMFSNNSLITVDILNNILTRRKEIEKEVIETINNECNE